MARHRPKAAFDRVDLSFSAIISKCNVAAKMQDRQAMSCRERRWSHKPVPIFPATCGSVRGLRLMIAPAPIAETSQLYRLRALERVARPRKVLVQRPVSGYSASIDLKRAMFKTASAALGLYAVANERSRGAGWWG